MKQWSLLLAGILFLSCNNSISTGTQQTISSSESSTASINGRWEGAFTNGMKETYISFDVSEDGKEVKNLTFKGYWRCDGKLDQTILGPTKSFSIADNKVDGVIAEPEGGGATATRYELHGIFTGDSAEGWFRMNINALGCDTYKLTWTAKKK